MNKKSTREIGLAQNAEPRLPSSPLSPRPVEASLVGTAIQKSDSLSATGSLRGKTGFDTRFLFVETACLDESVVLS